MPEERSGKALAPEAGGRGASDKDIYNGVDDPNDAKDTDELARDVFAEAGGAEEDEDKPAGKKPESEDEDDDLLDEDLDEEDDDEEEAGGEKAKSDEEDDGDEEKRIEARFWDPDRQKKDQERANQRKALEEERDSLKTQVSTLQTQLEEAKRKPEQQRTTGTDDRDARIEKLLSSLEKVDLDDEDGKGAEVIVDTQKELLKLLKERKAAGEDTGELAALKQEITELRDERKREKAEAKEKADADAQREAQADVDRFVAQMDEEHGDHLHNRAFKVVSKRLRKAGYDGEKRLPDAYTVKLEYERAYKKLAKKYPRTKSKARKQGKVPRTDPGSGGGDVPAIKTGTREEVAEAMLRAGKFAPKE
jgi:hypothetical protein